VIGAEGRRRQKGRSRPRRRRFGAIFDRIVAFAAGMPVNVVNSEVLARRRT
jgi:hypothetical protein